MRLPSPPALLKRQLVGRVYVPYVQIPEGRMVELLHAEMAARTVAIAEAIERMRAA